MIKKKNHNEKEISHYKTSTNGIIEKSISLLILILLSPIILIVLEIVLLITGEPPIFKQKRGLTLEEKFINIYKIRTIKSSYRVTNGSRSSNIFYKSENKNNVSRFCSFLRKTGFDEILQLINVLQGEMSIVGPRPLMVSDLELMKKTDIDLYKRRKQILSKPGITGYWQVFGIREEGILNLIKLEEFYEKNKSLRLDSYLIIKTIFIILTVSHSDSIVSELKRNSEDGLQKAT